MRRTVLLGLDSVIPHFARRFIAEGYMPNLERLVRRGFWTDTMPTMPPWTPPGWASVATGAWPSTHGIEGFGVYVPGEPLSHQHEGFDSRLWRAESIWEAAARASKRSILVKYPGMWPHKPLPLSIQVGGLAGYGGRKSGLDITHSQCFGSDLETGGQAIRITLHKSADGTVETSLPVTPLREPHEVKRYRVVLERSSGKPRARIEIGNRDRSAIVLEPGQWSDFIIDSFICGGQEVDGGFRFKLLQLSDGLDRVRIYMTQNHPVRGYTTPPSIADGLLQNVGPMVEYSEAFYEFYAGLIDETTYLEVFESHASWHERAMRWLAANHEWDLLVTQNHIIDNAQHSFWCGIDTGHPDHDPAKAAHYWDVLGRCYSLVDRLIGAAEDIAGRDGLVVVTGDHGHEPRRYTFHINNWLARHGYLEAEETGSGWQIDWTRTRAVAMGPVHIMLNVADRNPDGIVAPGAEYERLREEIVNSLYQVRHDVTGQQVLHVAFHREDMDMFGLYGDGVGDIIYAVRPGFDVGASMRTQSLESFGLSRGFPLFSKSVPFRELTSQHCSVLGFTPNNRTWTVFAGPGIRQAVSRRIPIRLADIAPTISFLAGFPLPRQTEGQLIVDLLDDPSRLQAVPSIGFATPSGAGE